MKLRNDIRQRMEPHFKPGDTEYDKIVKAATVLNDQVSEVIDFSERNWEEDKFRFNDEKEVLEEIYINYLPDDEDKPSAVVMKFEYPYLDIATAMSLYSDRDPYDMADEVWTYVTERADFPESSAINEPEFGKAEELFAGFKADFSNISSDGPGFCKDHIKKLTTHLTELGYFPRRSA